MIGKRKLLVVILFGVFTLTAFLFTPHDVACYTAFVGALVGLAGWFHQANVQVHKNGNGDKPIQ